MQLVRESEALLLLLLCDFQGSFSPELRVHVPNALYPASGTPRRAPVPFLGRLLVWFGLVFVRNNTRITVSSIIVQVRQSCSNSRPN